MEAYRMKKVLHDDPMKDFLHWVMNVAEPFQVAEVESPCCSCCKCVCLGSSCHHMHVGELYQGNERLLLCAVRRSFLWFGICCSVCLRWNTPPRNHPIKSYREETLWIIDAPNACIYMCYFKPSSPLLQLNWGRELCTSWSLVYTYVVGL